MRSRSQPTLPGAANSASNITLTTIFGERRKSTLLASRTGKRCRIAPGLLPRLAIPKASISNPSGAPAGPSPEPAASRQDGTAAAEPRHDTSASAGQARPVRPGRPQYKLSEDPLLRQTQMLLEASRRLREQSLAVPIVDRGTYYGSSSLQLSAGQHSGTWPPGPDSGPQEPGMPAPMSAPRPIASLDAVNAPESAGQLFASFGTLAAASATAAASITAARITALNAAAAAATAAAGNAAAFAVAGPPGAAAPPVLEPSSASSTSSGGGVAATASGSAAGRAALTAAATTASLAAYGAVAPGAANASGALAGAGMSNAAAAAAAAATSGWLAIEELLEEAAYSLSQELPDSLGPSPLGNLMVKSAGSAAARVAATAPSLGVPLELPAGLVPPQLAESVPAALTSLGLAPGVGAGPGFVAAVPGGDRLSEMLEDMLYSLSQDINLAATQEAVVSAATAAAAGLAGAAAELPRAAVAVYRSAAEAAAAAAAARVAAVRVGGGSSGLALYVPPEDATELPPPLGYESIAEVELLAAVAGDNPGWDPYGTIRAAELGGSVATVASADTGAATAAAAAADAAVAALPPVVTAAEAATVADAAAATAAAVVEAATTTAAGTVMIAPPSSVIAPPSGAVASAAVASTPGAAQPAPVTPPPQVAEAIAPPTAAAAPPAPPPLTETAPGIASDAVGGDGAQFGLDAEGVQQQLDELAAALQSLLTVPEVDSGLPGAAEGLEAASGAAAAAASAAAPSAAGPLLSDDPAAAEAALTSLTEALRRELGAVVDRAAGAVDTDPAALAQAAGQAVSSALGSLSLEQVDLSYLSQDVRLSTLLGVTLQSSLDLVESALGGIRSADSTVVGGITIAAIMAVLIRALVSMAATSMSRVAVGAGGAADGAAAGFATATRVRPEGVTALEAAAALNNDPQALLLDIRNGSDVQEQGLPDLRPFRRGKGANTVPLPYCDFRTVPTLSNPSGSLLAAVAGGGRSAAAAAGALVPATGAVTVSVDPMFIAKFKQLEGLTRDSRVFLIDSYGVEAPEAAALLRSDAEVERLLGTQGIKYVEGGFAGPEGWKLTGLPVADAPSGAADGGEAAGGRGLGLDMSGLLSGVAGLRLRYPSLFTRTLAVGAVGGTGVAMASNLDWGAVSRGAVGLAAAMLVTDRALPDGMKPSGRIRQYLQAQLSEAPQAGEAAAGGSSSADLEARRRRTALLLRALDLAEAVGDGIVRAGGAAVTAAGNAARGAMVAGTGANKAATVDIDVEPELETAQPLPAAAPAAATIVLPHGMDSLQWSQAAESAVAQAQQLDPQQPPAAAAVTQPASQQQQRGRSASPLRPNWRLGPSSAPAEAGNPAVAGGVVTSAPAEPRPAGTSLAGHLTGVLRNAADAVIRAASPARAGSGSRSGTPAAARAASPKGPNSTKPDTLDLMTALAAASSLSSLDTGLVPGWPAVSFPRASAGQAPPPPQQQPTEDEEVLEEKAERRESESEDDKRGSVVAETMSVPKPETVVVAPDEKTLWGSWRQELEAVAPPPPKLPLSQEGGEGSRSSQRGSNGGSGGGAGRQQRKPLRTASPERAAAAAAAMRRMRMQMEGLDDDGLAIGAYGNEGPSAGGGDDAISGGMGGGAAAAAAPAHEGFVRPKKPLRTASPERAAAAATAMRKLRAEMGLPPNDGVDGSSAVAAAAAQVAAATAAAVVPRDWRRELEAAAEPNGGATAAPRGFGGGSSSSGGTSDGLRRPASSSTAPPPSRSPRNWRDQLEGRVQPAGVGRRGGAVDSAAPADWRSRIESSDGLSTGDGGSRVLLRTGGGASPSRGAAKLTATERAERDARLQDWRAKV